MTREEFEQEHGVRLVCKDKVLFFRMIGFFWGAFQTHFWTTWRWPFGQGFIGYPTSISEEEALSLRKSWIRAHELIHAKKQQATAWGLFKSFWFYFLIPLPVFFSGRWFLEREPYLSDIQSGKRTPEKAAEMLWGSYFFPWPKSWMKAWFEKEVDKARGKG